MRHLILILAVITSLTASSQTVFKVNERDSLSFGETLYMEKEDKSIESFTEVYAELQILFDYNEIDPDQPLIDDSVGEYDINNMSELFRNVTDGTNVELVYTLQATDKHYVAAHVYFDTDGYGIIIWSAIQPDYDPRKVK